MTPSKKYKRLQTAMQQEGRGDCIIFMTFGHGDVLRFIQEKRASFSSPLVYREWLKGFYKDKAKWS